MHLQDYNLQTLQLVTFPNMFLTWYISHFSKDSTGEAEINEEVIALFKKHLIDDKVDLRFSYGAWKALDSDIKYDYLLTSETVYRTESIPPLVQLIQSASHENTATLVATKGIYFGVGGGVREFSDYLASNGHSTDVVWTKEGTGVSRHILKVIL